MELVNFLWFVVKVMFLVFLISFIFEIFVELVIMTPIRNRRNTKMQKEYHNQIMEILKEKGLGDATIEINNLEENEEKEKIE